MEIAIYFVAALLGIFFRYNLGFSQACKFVGTSISSSGSGSGFQDAVTPPFSTNFTLLTWVAIVCVFGFAVYKFGWETFGFAIGAFFVSSVIAGAVVIPKSDSKHFVERIYRSMVSRFADYVKEGDTLRADAMKHLIDKIEANYRDKLIN